MAPLVSQEEAAYLRFEERRYRGHLAACAQLARENAIRTDVSDDEYEDEPVRVAKSNAPSPSPGLSANDVVSVEPLDHAESVCSLPSTQR